MRNLGHTLYMGQTRTGSRRHLIADPTLRAAVYGKHETAPALCGVALTSAVVGDKTPDHGEWVVKYAAHWDDHGLCFHCREKGNALLEEPRSCSAEGCDKLFPATDAVLVWCEEHYAMVGPP